MAYTYKVENETTCINRTVGTFHSVIQAEKFWYVEKSDEKNSEALGKGKERHGTFTRLALQIMVFSTTQIILE